MKNLDKHFLALLLAGYTIKLLALGASLPDAGVILVLAAAHYMFNSQIQNKRVDALEEKINETKELIQSLKDENESIKASVGNAVVGIKMSNGFINKK